MPKVTLSRTSIRLLLGLIRFESNEGACSDFRETLPSPDREEYLGRLEIIAECLKEATPAPDPDPQ